MVGLGCPTVGYAAGTGADAVSATLTHLRGEAEFSLRSFWKNARARGIEVARRWRDAKPLHSPFIGASVLGRQSSSFFVDNIADMLAAIFEHLWRPPPRLFDLVSKLRHGRHACHGSHRRHGRPCGLPT